MDWYPHRGFVEYQVPFPENFTRCHNVLGTAVEFVGGVGDSATEMWCFCRVYTSETILMESKEFQRGVVYYKTFW